MSNLFQVYLRLRPPTPGISRSRRFLSVEQPANEHDHAMHITLDPPTERRRAVEKFGFTRVLEEHASQLDVLQATQVLGLIEGVLAPEGGPGTDALVATLGVTGSGKVGRQLKRREEKRRKEKRREQASIWAKAKN